MKDAHKNKQQKEQGIQPDIRIGKKGLTEGIVKEMQSLLERKGIVNIKMLRSFLEEQDKKTAAAELELKLQGTITKKMGNLLVLTAKNKSNINKEKKVERKE